MFFISLYVIKEASADSHELTATPLGQYSVRLEWIEPSKIPDEKSIIDYEIRYKETSDADYITFDDGVSLSTSVTVTGLKKGTLYYFQVRAILSPFGKINIGEVTATTYKITHVYSPDPPKISGVGLYTITLSESADNPYLESGSYTRKIGTRFEDFFPYSKFSDELDSQNYGTIQNYEKRGQYFFTDEYSTSIPTLFGKVNQPIQIQVRITDQSDITKVRHLSFYTDVRGTTSDKQFSNAYVIFEKGQDITVFDSNGLFKDVKVSSLIENDQFWVILDFTFNKPMEKSDILLETWNEGRKPVYAKIVNAWDISELKQVEKQEEIPLNAQVEITHDAASPVCSGDNTCYDSFEAKITTGGTVTWINTDSFIHTVTNGVPERGEDQPHLFEGYMSPGRSYQLPLI